MNDTRNPSRKRTEFVAEIVKRAPLFHALRDGPANVRQLESNLSMSRSTIHRAMQTFDERGLVRKHDGAYELTNLGQTVASELSTFYSHVEAARRLESFLNTVEPNAVEIPVEYFEDATVTQPQEGHAHIVVKRILELIEETDSLRMFSSVISPVYVEVAYREMMDGTSIEVVFDESLVDIILSEYHDRAVQAFETGLFDVYVYDGVPFELFLFDDTTGMAAHDADGIPRAFVETDDPDAREWAEQVYERYLDRATRITIDG